MKNKNIFSHQIKMSNTSLLNFSEYKLLSNEEITRLSDDIIINEGLSESALKFLAFLKGESIDLLVNGFLSNRNIVGIYNFCDDDLERYHDYIQWIFPTITASAFNKNAPVLTLSDYEILRSSWPIRKIIYYLALKLLNYWGFYNNENSRLNLLHGHNGLRLSRLIECLTLFWFDVSWIITKITDLIAERKLSPKYMEYNGEIRPIWIIRYLENKDK